MAPTKAVMMLDRIVSAVDSTRVDWLAQVGPRLAAVALSGNHRRFLVNRMGSTGSVWLAKLLNSHPDVFCYHEGVVSTIIPDRSYSEQDILEFIDVLAADRMHEAYQAVGDVGSAWLGHVINLKAFTTAVLLRHPARVLNTRMAVYPHDKSFTELSSATKSCIQQIWDIDLERLGPLDRIFLHDLCTFALQAYALGKVEMIRIEEMRDLESCRAKLTRLTGLDYELQLIEAALKWRINRRTGAQRPIGDILLQTFTRQQREWYFLVLRDIAPRLGYDLENDVPSKIEDSSNFELGPKLFNLPVSRLQRYLGHRFRQIRRS
jgi:hypothetical protein